MTSDGWAAWPLQGAPGELGAALAVMGTVLAAYWLIRVGQAARRQLRPAAAWWAAPGLGLLLLAPVLDVPALFGLGAALLLLAEYWPRAFRPAAGRPGVGWPLVGLVMGAALAAGLLRRGLEPGTFFAALVLLLWSAGAFVSAALFRRTAAPTPLGFSARWKTPVTPAWPELSVTLSARGAHLRNVSGTRLWLAGWSPAGVNAWYRVRTERGEAVVELAAGQEAVLPVSAYDSGVRVWYAPARTPSNTHLFRADWTPPAHAEHRVLN
ncbi:hypothetical protein [Deinococcus multiflagellatus]|uniref:Uncharacterized protein n=1 Tax=Deinococcus multiflagellatus TaxID=1656887 RepID=A0ABW1ZGD1_9DEIO|nr:hypothetical protein [Deinococcus multiflagellatus]MBZ9714554.1 hypothetical protein [Deinococcus multiflagellatus]